jgi:hypothetical protein
MKWLSISFFSPVWNFAPCDTNDQKAQNLCVSAENETFFAQGGKD